MLEEKSVTNRLLVFTRYPQPGKAKTRLIPALGAEAAADLQRQMTEHTLEQVLAIHPSLSVEIWFARISDDAETDRRLMQSWLGERWSYCIQSDGDLGQRLIQAIASAFRAEMQRVVTIGADCPELDASRIQQAFEQLEQHDVVLGPATDGGYYLIGLRQFRPELFKQIAWSSEIVLQQTIGIIKSLGLTVAYLEPLTDIDRPEDLTVWQRVRESWRGKSGD